MVMASSVTNPKFVHSEARALAVAHDADPPRRPPGRRRGRAAGRAAGRRRPWRFRRFRAGLGCLLEVA